jgi:hypothetical protein
VVIHIVAVFGSLNNSGVRSQLLRVAVACAAFVAGVLVGTVHRYVRQPRLLTPAEIPAPSPAPTPVEEEIYPAYPETFGLSPREIANFINDYPQANLDRLWQRLRVTDDPDALSQFTFSGTCANCAANIFEYNLDADVDREVVLQIKQGFGEMYRYLIFNDARDLNPKFLGKVDVWTKYRPSDPVVLVSNERSWLILQNTAATGSGLGAWTDTVYEVSDSGVREVGSYLGEVKQGGGFGFPSKAFIGRLVSCEAKNGRALLKVSYTVEYFGYNTHLFTKQKTVVLGVFLTDGSSFVVAGHSEITPYEFETIYNFDSMGKDDFLTYNRDELRAIATGNESEKKTWLKEFLDTCEDSAIKRELLKSIKEPV